MTKKEASIIIEKGIVIFKVVGNIRFHNVFFYNTIWYIKCKCTPTFKDIFCLKKNTNTSFQIKKACEQKNDNEENKHNVNHKAAK